MFRGALLCLLLLLPTAAALTLDLQPQLPVLDASATAPGLAVEVPGVATVAASPSKVSVAADAIPALPALSVAVPALSIAVPSVQVAPLPAAAPTAPRHHAQALPAVPAGPAVPVAGGFAALALLGWALLRQGVASLPGAAWLFSRLDKPRLLEHPHRARILDLVTARPGIIMEEVRKGTGLAWGTTVHHLRTLERNGVLVSLAVGGHRLWFTANTQSPRQRTSIAALAQPTARRIAQKVHESPGLAQAELCDALGLRAPAASKHLGQLAQVGLVTVRPDGHRRRYEGTLELGAALAIAA